MKYGICNLSVVPCRAEPSDKSEMVTQLLFGETFEIIGNNGNWLNIRNSLDAYESWIDNKQFLAISANAFEAFNNKPAICAADLVQIITDNDSKEMQAILAGSSLPNYHKGSIAFADQTFTFDGDFCSPEHENKQQAIRDNSLTYLHAPYLWGGRSPFGIDCSGLTQVIFKMIGIALKRDAWQQAEQGVTLSFVEEAEVGDLAFFDNEEGEIIHVGIIIGENKIIHASGKVRIDKIDHQGIYNVDYNDYSHKLRLLKRVL